MARQLSAPDGEDYTKRFPLKKNHNLNAVTVRGKDSTASASVYVQVRVVRQRGDEFELLHHIAEGWASGFTPVVWEGDYPLDQHYGCFIEIFTRNDSGGDVELELAHTSRNGRN